MKHNLKNWKKRKEPFLILLLCLIILVVGIASLRKIDNLQRIFDPDSLVAVKKDQQEELDKTGYGLKEKDEASGGQEDGETDQSDNLEQQHNQLRKLDSLAPEGEYRGTKTTEEKKTEKQYKYIDEEKNQGEEIADSGVAPGKAVGSDDNRASGGISDQQVGQEDSNQESGSGDSQIPDNNNPGSSGETGTDGDSEEPGNNGSNGNNENKPTDNKNVWVLDDITVQYYRDKEAVLFYKAQIPSEEYVRGNVKVVSHWHESNNIVETKTETEKEFVLSSIPDDFAHKLTEKDVGDTFVLNLECLGIKKQVKCQVKDDTITYTNMKVSYKETPAYVVGEKLTQNNIQKAIQLDVYGKTTSGNEDVYLPDQKNYKVIFKDETNDTASKNQDSITGEWKADIEYYGSGGDEVPVRYGREIVKYVVKDHKLTMMYDKNTVLSIIYTDDPIVVFNQEYNGISPYNQMIQKLKADGKYKVSEDGYLTELFYGWSPDASKLDGKYISYQFKTGQTEQIMYPIPLKEVLREGYLIRQDGNDQVLVGYIGEIDGDGTLEIPYGITKIALNQEFQVSDQASAVTKMIISETVNSVDLSAAGEKFTHLQRYQAQEDNFIFNTDEMGLLYSEDGTVLWKVPADVTEFSLNENVTKIAAGALCDVAAFAAAQKSEIIIHLLSDNPPELEKLSDKNVFGGERANLTFMVKDTSETESIKDIIYKRYVSAWGQLLDEEMGEEGAASKIIRTETHVEDHYDNKGGNVYSYENEHKMLEFIPKDTGEYYEVETDVYGIGSYAFVEAEKLQFIKIKDNVKEVKPSSFESGSENQLQGVEIESNEIITIGEKVVGDSVSNGFHIYLSSIQNEVSGWMSRLTADYGQEKAENILIFAEGEVVVDDLGCAYVMEDEEKGWLTLCSVPNDIDSFTVPEGYHIVTLAQGAFEGCGKLVNIELPDVKEVGKNVFKECSSMEIAVLTSKKLDSLEETFEGCDSLETLLIHNDTLEPDVPEQTVVLKGDNYFSENGLIYETIGNHEYQLKNLPSSTKGTVRLKKGTSEIGDNAFADCDKVSGLYEEQWKEIDRIGNNAFRNCSSLSVEAEILFEKSEWTQMTPGTLSVNAAEIGENAFKNCSGVSTVIFGKNCRKLGEGSFSGCTSLEDIYWKGEVETIGDSAFSGCTSLREADLSGTGITDLSAYVFYGCTSLKRLTLPTTLKEIKEQALSSCTKLSEITILNSKEVLKIHRNAMQATKENANLKIYIPLTENHILLTQYRCSVQWIRVFYLRLYEVIQEMDGKTDQQEEEGLYEIVDENEIKKDFPKAAEITEETTESEETSADEKSPEDEKTTEGEKSPEDEKTTEGEKSTEEEKTTEEEQTTEKDKTVEEEQTSEEQRTEEEQTTQITKSIQEEKR